FGSPLMIGAELTLLDEATLSLLTNDDVLAMLPPSVKPHQICRDSEKAVWRADDATANTHYVALFNLGEEEQKLSVSLEELGYGEKVSLKELWTGDNGTAESVISTSIAPHACVVYQVNFL
ncbi:MAG: alpha-galactosidase, partial [Acetatifactor sp.]|nr:alpha-galactosidase [Acetatifactor sp.]